MIRFNIIFTLISICYDVNCRYVNYVNVFYVTTIINVYITTHVKTSCVDWNYLVRAGLKISIFYHEPTLHQHSTISPDLRIHDYIFPISYFRTCKYKTLLFGYWCIHLNKMILRNDYVDL
jgi:hypothetical protein